MNDFDRAPTDVRKDRARQERRLLISAVLLFLVAGGILIGTLYGWQAIITGLLCLLPGLIGLVLLWLLLRFLERISDRWK